MATGGQPSTGPELLFRKGSVLFIISPFVCLYQKAPYCGSGGIRWSVLRSVDGFKTWYDFDTEKIIVRYFIKDDLGRDV